MLGVCALQPGSATGKKGDTDPPVGSRLISLEQLKPIDGLTIRYRRNWATSFIDGCIKTVKKAAKHYTLLAMSGDNRQPWTESNVAAYSNLARRLGGLYARDPDCLGVHVTGCTPQGVSEEPHWDQVTPQIESAMRKLFAAWATNFPAQTLIMAISLKDPPAMRRLIDYALDVAHGRLLVKHNALSAKMAVDAPQNELLVYAAKRGAQIGFEMLSGSNEERFGGTWAEAMANKAAIERACGVGACYEAVYPGDLELAGNVK